MRALGVADFLEEFLNPAVDSIDDLSCPAISRPGRNGPHVQDIDRRRAGDPVAVRQSGQTGIILGRIETEQAGVRRRRDAQSDRHARRITGHRSDEHDQRPSTLDGLAPGKYIVTAEKPGFVTKTSAPIDVPPTARTVDLVLTPGGALEGRLQDDRNAPIAREIVTADRLTEQGTVAASYVAATDDLGRFRIHSLPAGRYRMRATPRLPASGDQYFYPGTITASDVRDRRHQQE
jgi:hypothetical protein